MKKLTGLTGLLGGGVRRVEGKVKGLMEQMVEIERDVDKLRVTATSDFIAGGREMGDQGLLYILPLGTV